MKGARAAAWVVMCVVVVASISGCDNSPFTLEQRKKAFLYQTFYDEPSTLDPTAGTSIGVLNSIYETYFSFHYLKQQEPQQILSLGAKWPEITPYPYTTEEDGKRVQKMGERWDFEINDNLYFSPDPAFGGKKRKVTGNDFIYSLRRMADPSIAASWGSAFDNRILGFKEYVTHNRSRQEKKLAPDYEYPVEGLIYDPKEPLKFSVILTSPFPQFRYLFGLRATAPQAREAVEYWRARGQLSRHPVGCGPYMIEEYNRQRIVLKKNPYAPPEFYPTDGEPGDKELGLLEPAGKRLPLNDGVIISFIKEPTTAWNRFLQGYQDSYGVGQQNYSQVMSGTTGRLSDEMKRRGISMQKIVKPSVIGFLFNMEDPVFGGYTAEKKKLRQAISLALDSQEIIELFRSGFGKPAHFIVPPGLPGYDPSFVNPYATCNIDKAKKLLSEAGYPNGIDPKTRQRLELQFLNGAQDPISKNFIQIIQRQIERIGIRVVNQAMRGVVLKEKLDKGNFQFMEYGWYADYPDPENFLQLLYGENKRPGINKSSYDNPEFNKLYPKMLVTPNGPERDKILHRMRDIVVEDCPWIFGRHEEIVAIGQEWLKNRKLQAMDVDINKYISIDTELRLKRQSEWNKPNVSPLMVILTLMGLGSLPAVISANRRRHRKARGRK